MCATSYQSIGDTQVLQQRDHNSYDWSSNSIVLATL